MLCYHDASIYVLGNQKLA